MRYPSYIEEKFSFPKFFKVKMNYPRLDLKDIEKTLNQTLDKILCKNIIRAGGSVAVGVGSRGIDKLPLIVKTVCLKLKAAGAVPVIIPSMGSHGGATEEGQKDILAKLGITAESCGAEIQTSLNVKQVGTVLGEVPVFFSENALCANHSICINRIKAHTKFKAPVESGIFKMLCVGMGKHQGALAYHKWALKYGFFPVLQAMGNEIIEKTNFRFGIAIVEDAYDKTMIIEAISKEEIFETEKKLLQIANKNMAKIPVKKTDVLVICQIGKEISGAGMDPNITGRAYDLKEDDFSGMFSATRIAILNLSSKTKGNGIGLGNADFITEKVYNQLDYEATVMNALTGMSLRKAFIPIRLDNDLRAIQACFTTIGPVLPNSVRAIIIKDTGHLYEFWASEALRDEIMLIPESEISETISLEFDSKGNLCNI